MVVITDRRRLGRTTVLQAFVQNEPHVYHLVNREGDIDAVALTESLERKARRVQWRDEAREERYAIFAKSFARRSPGADCLDLEDLAAVVAGDDSRR